MKKENSKEMDEHQIALKRNGAVIAMLGEVVTKKISKRGKDSFVETIMAAASATKALAGYKSTLPPNKSRIILFDTTQADYYAQLTLRRIQQLGGCMDKINMYAIRNIFSQKDRLRFIKEVVYSKNDLGIVIINEINDLIYNINNQMEVAAVKAELWRLAGALNIHIMTISEQPHQSNYVKQTECNKKVIVI